MEIKQIMQEVGSVIGNLRAMQVESNVIAK